ncbi:zinc finger cchc domain-containing protein [Anaeramoeba flamelloides]|uniref:Zinc finger cchc domain-containing protein n=1 Tax=Anaeramoeba flamelloides TaxID=1746091 RepID=A0ABQ8X449_9EUKA|nr:zinc finger cchc domain-containing protein [Anaeramoeba flamelloides]
MEDLDLFKNEPPQFLKLYFRSLRKKEISLNFLERVSRLREERLYRFHDSYNHQIIEILIKEYKEYEKAEEEEEEEELEKENEKENENENTLFEKIARKAKETDPSYSKIISALNNDQINGEENETKMNFPRKRKKKRSKRKKHVDAFTREEITHWSGAKLKSWKNRRINPNTFYYRFKDPGKFQDMGDWSELSKKQWIDRYNEFKSNGWKIGHAWGLFSKKVNGRVGYQCSNYYRRLLKEGVLEDPSYGIDTDGVFRQIHPENVDQNETMIPESENGLNPVWELEELLKFENEICKLISEIHPKFTMENLGSRPLISVEPDSLRISKRKKKTIYGFKFYGKRNFKRGQKSTNKHSYKKKSNNKKKKNSRHFDNEAKWINSEIEGHQISIWNISNFKELNQDKMATQLPNNTIIKEKSDDKIVSENKNIFKKKNKRNIEIDKQKDKEEKKKKTKKKINSELIIQSRIFSKKKKLITYQKKDRLIYSNNKKRRKRKEKKKGNEKGKGKKDQNENENEKENEKEKGKEMEIEIELEMENMDEKSNNKDDDMDMGMDMKMQIENENVLIHQKEQDPNLKKKKI